MRLDLCIFLMRPYDGNGDCGLYIYIYLTTYSMQSHHIFYRKNFICVRFSNFLFLVLFLQPKYAQVDIAIELISKFEIEVVFKN